MCVNLAVYCKSCVCYFATSCIPSLMPSQCTVAVLSYHFTDKVILADEVSTVKFVAAQLSPLKKYPASVVCKFDDITSCQESYRSAYMVFRQSGRGLISIMLLVIISLYGFLAI